MRNIVIPSERQFNVQHISKVRSKNFEKHGRYETNIPKFSFKNQNYILTLTIEVSCRSNLFVFEGHCNGVYKDKAQRQYDNKMWNNKLKYEKNDTFLANFLFL